MKRVNRNLRRKDILVNSLPGHFRTDISTMGLMDSNVRLLLEDGIEGIYCSVSLESGDTIKRRKMKKNPAKIPISQCDPTNPAAHAH